ncbi:ribosomal protein S18-alanine N-acetyltransferase [Pseudoleptotrichia goodfellowii]|uniref:[Ribosomal protein bS18]-alanine N-acetyltransferase n=1 Tax=Pseudoleptotrichia goodfellowii F0264 TaxID=596323 RepID=D0GP26_9FUSO|nr:ribosomal protein S18-alanine N-acetyltransferase [Pseudoleptotrichia goodfellowii]EEY34161.1 ribosomal-protein-alanine acetyltransferase [Pseudoleptotrichia goodfellowii F0264]
MLEKTEIIKICEVREEIVAELCKIHNENFDKKVESKYFEEILSNTQYTVYYMKKSEKVSGYIIYYDTFDSFDLFEIAIKKEFQNKGLGNELLEKTIDRLFNEEKYKKTVFLEVNENNFSAVKLYKKNNFKEISLRKNYYGIGQNAIIMVRNL